MKTRCGSFIVIALLLAGCGSAPSMEDATVACGWNEAVEPVVSPLEADSAQLAQYADRARVRLVAAQRVARADERFGPLVAALTETSELADELATMSREELEAVPTSTWDFAKYAQVTARDQCEQLAAVVQAR